MALVEKKNGGPYTKKEQEERRLAVYRLHFEENKSALEISQILGVNRITVTKDLQFWHGNLADRFGPEDVFKKTNLQVLRKENQRDRLLADLGTASEVSERLRIEKAITEIDDKLLQFYLKLYEFFNVARKVPLKFSNTARLEKKIEGQVEEFVKALILSNEQSESMDSFSAKYLKCEFMRKNKCQDSYADDVLDWMKKNGLVFFENSGSFTSSKRIFPDNTVNYDLGAFAVMRGFFTDIELYEIRQKRLNDNLDKSETSNEGFKN